MEMRIEIENELKEHIIPFWKSLKDEENGGFYGELDFDLNLKKFADKGCILNSRILWFFSTASMVLNDKNLLSYAEHSYKFLENYCLDKKYGGVYWSVTYDGKPADTTKHTYNQAFAIYALSAYYRASGNNDAIKYAKQIFDVIESKCCDDEGYFEAYTYDFKPESNEKLSENGVMATRTMNTLLHVFEGYSGLYEATKDKEVAEKLYFITDVFSEKIYNKKRKRQDVFFDKDYKSLIDLHSYGHDIETAWLIEWGYGLLDDKKLMEKVSTISDALVESVYQKAFVNNSLLCECERGVNNTTRVWWVQAEAVTGFINAWQKHPERVDYYETAQCIWGYIKEFFIDTRQGSEWFYDLDENGVPQSRKSIAEEWKCPYHNGRMCFEMMRRLK